MSLLGSVNQTLKVCRVSGYKSYVDSAFKLTCRRLSSTLPLLSVPVGPEVIWRWYASVHGESFQAEEIGHSYTYIYIPKQSSSLRLVHHIVARNVTRKYSSLLQRPSALLAGISDRERISMAN